MTHEEIRLEEARLKRAHWQRWGPYLSERAWGTVREDYSPYGNAWEYLPHDHARSRAYRWNEDGIAGICDRHQYICFAVALWNGRDPILKERLFGLTGNEGNHGEDVKECYYYLDSTPTHSYMKYLYKYPQAAFPYAQLVEENRRRDKQSPEFELMDTGVFAENRYFDVLVEYAKNAPEDILVRITVTNHGPERAELHLLPTVWFRNTWSWGNESGARPVLREVSGRDRTGTSGTWSAAAGVRGQSRSCCSPRTRRNFQRLFGVPNATPYVKDGINEYVVHGAAGAVNPARTGTKAAARYALSLEPGETQIVRLQAARVRTATRRSFGAAFDRIFADAHSRSRRVLRDGDSGRSLSGCPQRDAAGVRRDAVVEAVLSLRGPRLAEGRSGGAAASGGTDRTGAITNGRISTTPTSSRCRTSGSIRGTRPGTWRFIACRWRWWIRSSPSSSSC